MVPRPRNGQIVRVLRLIRHLRAGRWTLAALSHELSVSEQSIRRDLAAIEEAHLPILSESIDGVRQWWMTRTPCRPEP